MMRLKCAGPLAGLLACLANVVVAQLPMRPLPPPQGQQCPDSCHESGRNPANWSTIADFRQVSACTRPVLLDFSLDIPTTENQFIRACDAWGTYYVYTPEPSFRIASGESSEEVVPQLAWSAAGSNSTQIQSGLRAITAVKEIQKNLQLASGSVWKKTILFGTFGGATVGVYVGENMLNPSVASSLFKPFMDKLAVTGIAPSKAALLQVCGQNTTGDSTFGVIAVGSTDYSTVQAAVKSWSNATCVDISTYTESEQLESISIRAKPLPMVQNLNSTTNMTTRSSSLRSILKPRADCTTISVVSGDSCSALASRCGISANDFTKYNSDSSLCSSLKEGQHVCCSSGNMPDFTPKENADGSCAMYETISGDNCFSIAARNGLEQKDLESLNKETWGWAGCESLFVGVRMCLSKGAPPMPAPISNAVCGPQKPNTSTPPSGTNITEMNPCPLNTCCNIWGQCGVTEDFCVDTRGSGAPGTAKKGTYGCISNCGMDIVKSDPPKQFIKLGYFEAFNLNRECLNMDVRQIDSSYTHVHFAFAMLKDDFTVYLEDEYQKYQFEQFKKLKGPKRIISFGGWTFSAERPYYTIFRNGVKTANRNTLATNIAKFINDNGLDGVDIDWEYPGAPDIPGIPPTDDPNEGTSYAAFLKILRTKLDSSKSLSIAAPASYWYLKQFPISGIAKVVDYIVFMTYDLHGQWDATNKWANPGCPSGSCLRSQINSTETLSALAMITKAGVPSNKVIVGVTSYGRSFQMVDPSCTGPDCLFTGGAGATGSGALPGRCTATSGYISNAEIKEISGLDGAKVWYDSESDSNIMTYATDNWVAYMTEATRSKRSNTYKGWNMGGTTNWAVDLEKFNDPPNLLEGSGLSLSWSNIKLSIKNGQDPTSCQYETRTGNWVSKECNEDVVTYPLKHTPKDRWDSLGCGDAWNDAKIRWKLCDRPARNGSFSASLSQFFHQVNTATCADLSLVDNCAPTAMCSAHHSSSDDKGSHTGAAAYEAWNSVAQVHSMIKNFHDTLRVSGQEVINKKATFLEVFAPAGSKPNYALPIGILLTIFQIPSTAMGTWFWKGLIKDMPYFQASGKDPALYLDLLKDSSQAMVMAGYTISQRFLTQSAIKEVSFDLIYSKLIGLWADQLDTLTKEMFDGSDEHIKNLDAIMKDGQMLAGSRSNSEQPGNHTDAFLREGMVERAFYAAAIPQVWKIRKPYPMFPVILDFGPGCSRDIGAGEFFYSKQDYNSGKICVDDHNYILAGTYDRNNDGPNCSPEYWTWCNNPDPKWAPLWTLPGLKDIQNPDLKWGNVTVNDLVKGSVNTWTRSGKKNIMDGTLGVMNPFNKQDFNELWDNDILAPGGIRIPICSPQEATFLATDGLGHGIPKENIASFPCLQDPNKRYESEWVSWPE